MTRRRCIACDCLLDNDYAIVDGWKRLCWKCYSVWLARVMAKERRELLWSDDDDED